MALQYSRSWRGRVEEAKATNNTEGSAPCFVKQYSTQCIHQRVDQAVLDEVKEVLRQNRIKRNLACQNRPDYDPQTDDIVIKDPVTGEVHRLTRSKASLDGGAPTRSYNNLYTDTQSAVSVISGELDNLPLYFVIDRTACMLCTRAMHAALRSGQNGKAVSDRNSKYGPAVAEEFALEKAGYNLLFEEIGKLRPAEEAVFLLNVGGDGDSKGAKRLIQKQVDALANAYVSASEEQVRDNDTFIDLGQARLESELVGRSIRVQDGGHVQKNLSNSMYTLKKKDSSLRGIGGLENGRVSAIVSDVRTHVNDLKEDFSKDDVRKDEALKIKAIKSCLQGIDSFLPPSLWGSFWLRVS